MATETPDEQTEKSVEPRFGADDYKPDFAKSLSDDEITHREKGEDSHLDSSNSDEKDSLFSGEEKPGRFSNLKTKLTTNGRRKATIGIVAGILGFGGIAGFSFIQGPLQAIHLAETLQKAFRPNEDLASTRMKGFYRFIKTGDVGETKVGILGSKMSGYITDQLKNQGITYERTNSGTLSKAVIDPTKNSELSKLNPEQRVSLISESLGVPEDSIRLTSGLYNIDLGTFNISVKRGLFYGSMGLAGLSKKTVALAGRPAANFYRVPSLFHPMQRADAAIDAKLDTRAKRIDSVRERLGKNVEPSPETVGKLNSIKDSVKPASVATGSVLSLTGSYCTIKEAVEVIPQLTSALTITPSIVGSYTAMAHGSQSKAGDDFKVQQLGDWVGSLTDKNKKTVWQAKSLNALSGKNTGTDLESGIKQAFSPNTSVSGLNEGLNSVPGGDAACSGIGIVVQAVAGGVLLVATAGTGTIIKSVLVGGVSAVAVDRVMNYIQHLAAGPDVAKAVFSGGPLGGNLLAHGAVAASGMVGRGFGGVAISRTASTEMRQKYAQEDNENFKNKSFASKVFDYRDSRSVAGQMVQKTDIDPKNSFGNIFGLIFNSPFSKVFAVDTINEPYDWPMPIYTIDDSILNSVDYANPYENADKVTAFIGDSPYIERAKKCFGVEIANDGSGWNVIPASDTNPASEEYNEGNCDQSNDENWNRVKVFVADTRLMNIFVCSEGSPTDVDTDRACQDSGINSNISQGELTSSPDPGATISGNVALILPGTPDAASYGYRDPEGQNGFHMALDWFAPANTSTFAPASGKIVRLSPDPNPGQKATGQVFGGTIGLRDTEGRLWVLRHISPEVSLNEQVQAGQIIGKVKDWAGPTHIHLELYRAGSSDREYSSAFAVNPIKIYQAAGLLVELECRQCGQ